MPANATRRQVVWLVVVLVVLSVVVAYEWMGAGFGGGSAGTASPPRAARTGSGGALAVVPSVRLDALNAERPQPAANGRNLFRERPKAPPPPPAPVRATPAAPTGPPDPNAPPPPPPPPPPITLKFIGVLRSNGVAVAVLSDGRDVLYGREGEVIDGRYRIIRVGVESVEISYLDGRGRRTIPLNGG